MNMLVSADRTCVVSKQAWFGGSYDGWESWDTPTAWYHDDGTWDDWGQACADGETADSRVHEEMIDTCIPEELANPAMLPANLQMAYMAGDYRESEYDDQYSAEAYWTTKGKFKGKGKAFFWNLQTLVSWDIKLVLKGPALPKTNQNALEKMPSCPWMSPCLLGANMLLVLGRAEKPHFFPKNLQKNHSISLD